MDTYGNSFFYRRVFFDAQNGTETWGYIKIFFIAPLEMFQCSFKIRKINTTINSCVCARDIHARVQILY